MARPFRGDARSAPESDTLSAMDASGLALPRHIVITGLMGVGKTTVGRKLANRLGIAWRDSDVDIEAQTGRTVRELRAQEGVDAMHAREAAQLIDAISSPKPVIVSAAASVIDAPACREAMAAPDVFVIWLHARPDNLADRFESDDKHRPTYGDTPETFLAAQAARREPLLASVGAHVIDTDGRSADEVVDRAERLLRGQPTTPERLRLILDVDTGIDDSLALLYAVASAEADIVAATCVSGNVDARQVAVNTRAVLELAGRADIEVALGREIPLVRALETSPETHGPQGLGHAELPEPSRPLSDRHAADLIVDEARSQPGEITLVTLGPLTNLAIAVLREPALPRLLKGYTLMGGAFGASGNTTPTTEWNIYCDPDAARIVFRAWADARAIDPTIPRPLALGLDVTEQARIFPDHVVQLARRAGSTPDDSIVLSRGEDPMQATRSVASNPIVRYVADALRFYMEFHARYDGFYGAFIHDPLAVAATLDRSLVTTQPLYVDVETHGELTTGMTVVDRRRLTGKEPNLDVAVSVDVAEFLDRLVERVGGLAANHSDVSG